MSTSLFQFKFADGTIKRILAQDAGGNMALDNAIIGLATQFMSASQIGGTIDVIIPAAKPPAVDDAPKTLFQVSLQNASKSLPLVLAWPRTTGQSTQPAALLAEQTAVEQFGGVAIAVSALADVDLDCTAVVPATVTLTKFAFRSLFTLAELIGIDNYATNTSLSAAQKATITTLLANFTAAENIVLGDPTTTMGVDYLASCGLITVARAVQILSAQPYLTITVPTIPNLTHGVAMTAVQAIANGGSMSGYAFTSTGLPDGVSISTSGQISGTPAVVGTPQATITVTDSAGDTASSEVTITVN